MKVIYKIDEKMPTYVTYVLPLWRKLFIKFGWVNPPPNTHNAVVDEIGGKNICIVSPETANFLEVEHNKEYEIV